MTSDVHSLSRIVVTILDSLDLDQRINDAGLLSLSRSECGQFYEQFMEDSVRRGFRRDEGAAYPNDLMVGEEIFEAVDMSTAAAFYALLHERLPQSTGVRVIVDQLMYRFKLAFALAESDELNITLNRQCAEFTVRSLDLFRQEQDRLPEAARQFFDFRLHFWLGIEWKQLDEYRAALPCLERAEEVAESVEDRLTCVIYQAQCKGKLGDPQGAYALLLQCRDEIDLAEEETRELWQMSLDGLEFFLGKSPQMQIPGVNGGPSIDFQMPDGAPDPEMVRSARLFLRKALEHPDERDPRIRHAWMTQLALILCSLDENREADLWMEEAKKLEAELEVDDPSIIRWKLTNARILVRRQEIDPAVKIFHEILAQEIDSDLRLQILGEALLAQLGMVVEKGKVDLPLLLDWTDQVATELEKVLQQQPLASARRRVREVKQRPLEAGLSALFAASEHVAITWDDSQSLLRQAWKLFMLGRNMELRRMPGSPVKNEKLLKLEASFHAQLRTSLLKGAADQPWTAALEALFEGELSTPQPQSRPEEPAAPNFFEEINHVAFIQFQDLLNKRSVAVLAGLGGVFELCLIEEPILDQLERWGIQWQPAEETGLRSIYREHDSQTSGEEPAPDFKQWLPESFASVGPEGDWWIFPDGPINRLPLEMLPVQDGERLGQDRAVVLCLRSAVPAEVRRPLGIDRGWLGLGDIPAAGEIIHLPGTGEEVREIFWDLSDAEIPCHKLLGVEARADRLAEELAARRPAVLHIATHGFADPDHPDACALILADTPDSPERELLPYRKIQDLPLESVDLVVLSVCSGSAGRTDRSAGMEGLAWAFLRCGVSQVVAGRYAVDDQSTVNLMLDFYRYLQEMPVAEALGRARALGLERGDALGQVAAWSVWC